MPNIPVAMNDRDYTIVDIDQIVFTSDAAELLTIADIRHNIAFVVRGASLSRGDARVPFCGLYVWSGNDGESPLLLQAKFALDRFFFQLRNQLMLNQDNEIYLYELAFVGGERLLFDEECEIINSGSEQEVNALQKVVREYDFKIEMIDMLGCNILFDNFLTRCDQEELSLTLSTFKWSKDIYTPTEDDSVDYDADLDSDSEPASMNRM